VAGWAKNDESVILYDKFDLWQIAPDGSRARRLTDGASEQVRHRYLRLNPDEELIDSEKPIYLGLFGVWTKKSGYARLRLGGEAAAERLVWLDKSVQRLAKADDQHLLVISLVVGRRALPIFWRAYSQGALKGRMKRYELAVIKSAFKLIFLYVKPGRIRPSADRGFPDDDLMSGHIHKVRPCKGSRL
jgi:hypothetical protein